jgi:hypothetical protein
MTKPADIGDSTGERDRLRALVAAVDHELSMLSGRLMRDDPHASGERLLSSSWAKLVEHLALGPAPRVRTCPVCAHVGMRDATRCGFCWTKLSPLGAAVAPE